MPGRRCTMKRLLTFGATALALAASVVGGASALTAGGPASFTDPVGDAKGAPDITAVSVADNTGSGSVTLSVTATAWPLDGDVDLYLNTDRNESTGSPSGSEYRVYYWRSPDGHFGWDMDSWSGGSWREMKLSGTMGFSRSGDVLTWRVSRADIGGAKALAFFVAGASYDENGDVRSVDYAPDDGTWAYDLGGPAVATPVPVDVKPFVGSPARAVAGGRITLTFPVLRSDTAGPLTTGTITSELSLGGKALRHTHRFARGKATITAMLPAGAMGKTLRVKVTKKRGSRRAARGPWARVRCPRGGGAGRRPPVPPVRCAGGRSRDRGAPARPPAAGAAARR